MTWSITLKDVEVSDVDKANRTVRLEISGRKMTDFERDVLNTLFPNVYVGVERLLVAEALFAHITP